MRKQAHPDIRSLGFKLGSEEDLDKAARFFAERQLPHHFVEKPSQTATYRPELNA